MTDTERDALADLMLIYPLHAIEVWASYGHDTEVITSLLDAVRQEKEYGLFGENCTFRVLWLLHGMHRTLLRTLHCGELNLIATGE